MSSNCGWIKITRRCLAGKIGHDGYCLAVWAVAIGEAYREDATEPLAGQGTVVKRGQFASSPAAIAKRLGYRPGDKHGFTPRVVGLRLDYLVKSGSLRRQTSPYGTIYTIVNFDAHYPLPKKAAAAADARPLATVHALKARAKQNSENGVTPGVTHPDCNTPSPLALVTPPADPCATPCEHPKELRKNLINKESPVFADPPVAGPAATPPDALLKSNPPTEWDHKAARWLQEAVLTVNPDVVLARRPGVLPKWADVFRLMREKDGLSKERISLVLHVTYMEHPDQFWALHVQSAEGFRAKWDRLSAQTTAYERRRGMGFREY